MIRLNDFSMNLGGRLLFKGLNCTLAAGQKVGLVGRNGAGKSTLLRILSGDIEVEGKELEIPRSLKRAYLAQEISARDFCRTVSGEAASAFSRLWDLHDRMEEVNKEISSAGSMAETPGMERLLELQDRLQEELHSSEFYQMDALIKKVLLGLGFSSEDLAGKASDLSGGWIMRLELAKILLQKPDFIFLDEPTNHLDLPSLSWLEKFLLSMDAGYVIVSHDRTFLDNTVDIIWELEAGSLTVYRGNYAFYEREREIRREQIRAARRNQQIKIDQLNAFVERFGAKASKARQAKSKLRQMERMDMGHEIAGSGKDLDFRLPEAPPSGKVVLQAERLSKSYDGKKVFSGVSFLLQRGEKMAVVGPNGAGKSSLLKILSGAARPDGGEVRTGHGVVPAYFGQHQALELDPSLDLLQIMYQLDLDMAEKEIRNILATFLFRKDDVKKRVSSLSGGEKSRLALARIMASRANLLLLDEPTNHLDMDSRKAVENALRRYNGTVVVVSHDRSFLDSFIDRVLEMEDQTCTLYPGKVEEFLYMKRRLWKERGETVETGGKPAGAKDLQFPVSRKDMRRYVSGIRQEKSRALKPLRNRISEIEAQIQSLEEQKSSLEERLSDPSFYKEGGEIQQVTLRYRETKEALKKFYQEWEETGTEIERISAEYDKLVVTE